MGTEGDERREAREYSGVVVGADGVFVQGRFIPYSRIRDVRSESRKYSGGAYGDVYWDSTVHWSVVLGLVGGHVMTLLEESTGGLVHMLAVDIKSSHKAWLAARDEPTLDVESVARGKQTGSSWLKALRRLGSRTSPYRAPPVDIERISQLLDDVRAKPWVRAAAAVVLASSGDLTSAEKLRVAAASMANPRIRMALSNVADARDDDAVAGALEILSAADGKKRGA